MIIIDPVDLKEITAAAESSYPDEACGLLVGRWATVQYCTIRQVVTSPNLATDKRNSFEIDWALRLDLQRRLRSGEDHVVGLYHSHPDQSAQPSTRDLSRAWEPDLVWLITSVLDGEAVLTAAHKIEVMGGRRIFREIPLHTSDWASYGDQTAMPVPGLEAPVGESQDEGGVA